MKLDNDDMTTIYDVVFNIKVKHIGEDDCDDELKTVFAEIIEEVQRDLNIK
jgi:hypothetical protein